MPIRRRFIALAVVGAIASAWIVGPLIAGHDRDDDWMGARARREAAALERAGFQPGFRLVDQSTESGITFVNQIVDDAGKAYKAVHYDHGMGICAADVDGDGLPDLFFPSQLGPSELWRNDGGGRLSNATDSSGIVIRDAVVTGCAFADIDNDGRPDLFVSTVRHGNRLFRNVGKGRFTDITRQAGVGYVGHSAGATFFDYDGDGRLDLFVANVGRFTTDSVGTGGYRVGMVDAFAGHLHPDRAERSLLYRNLGGGRFQDVTSAVGLVDNGFTGDAVVMDPNADGRPDLYVLNMQGEDRLWLNERGGFRDATREWFAQTPWGSMGAKVFDANRDGRLDLLITDMHSDMFGEVSERDSVGEAVRAYPPTVRPQFFPTGAAQFLFGNALFVDSTTGGGRARFVDRSGELGAETYWPWGPSVGDLDADGFDDVLVVGSMNYPFRYSPNALLLNRKGERFMHAEHTAGLEPSSADHLLQPWFTLDCGPGGANAGSPACDACTRAGADTVRCRPRGKGSFSVSGAKGARSSVLLDLDGDGDLDVVTNEFNAGPRVLLNDLSSRKGAQSLSLALRGTRSSRDGLGALVTVTLADGARLVKVMDGKSGYLSQSALPLYFGLGASGTVREIEVRWPTGRVQRVAGAAAAGPRVEVVEE